ncbi:MAG TPA: ATP-binding protein [Polyangiaceae bacterium]|jgi:two-component system nitrogen regulation sensor histidine kinase NtrY
MSPKMTIALRLLISFGALALTATLVIGFGAREAWRLAEDERFHEQLRDASFGVARELDWEAQQIRDLLGSKCAHDAYIDETLLELERREFSSMRRLAISQVVAEEMTALHLNELVLFTASGEVLGSGHDPAEIGKVDPELASMLTGTEPRLLLRPAGPKGEAALVTRCSKTLGSQTLGLMGARRLDTILDRIGKAYGVRLSLASSAPLPASPDEASVVVDPPSPELLGLRVAAARSRKQLEQNLARVDQRIILSSALTLAVAIAAAIWMARSVAGPIEGLARQAGEVLRGEPRPVTARGSRELGEFARAFNKALEDLVHLRKTLATTERIAARREIARRVAHEIKNPLAPIRAAVETLRRLRARGDPAFDEYFDEATRTVLEEVFRISKIVSEFTEFARLPPPHPVSLKVEDVARSAVSLYATGGADVSLTVSACPVVWADRDQLAQVLTNLIQNGLDTAQGDEHPAKVAVCVEPNGEEHVAIIVSDNGPGVSEEMLPKLFEPYATNKPHGTGLGLAIVQRIVHEHGGEIAYEPGKGNGAAVPDVTARAGAVFRVVLPIAGPTPLPAATEATAEAPFAPRG